MELKAGFKLSEAGPIPEDWQAVQLGSISDAKIGLTYSPADIRSQGTVVLRSSNILSDRLSLDDNVFVEPTVAARSLVRAGDLLICVRNGSQALIGKSAVIPDHSTPMAFGAFMTVLRSKERAFLAWAFRSDVVQRQVREHLGATINQITNASLKSFVTPWPPQAAERTAISSTLADLDSWIASAEAEAAKLSSLKAATLDALLTPTTRLPGFTDDWERVPLGRLLDVRHGKSQASVETTDGPFPILATGGQIGWASQSLHPGPAPLIGRKGTIDRPQLSTGPFWTIDTLFYCPPKADNNAQFLFALFHQIDWLRYNEASGVPSLSAATIEQIEVDVPPPAEQRAIAAVLSDIDAALAAARAVVTKARGVKAAAMDALLSGRVRLPGFGPARRGAPTDALEAA